MNEHGIVVPYQTYFNWHLAEVSSISDEQFKWKKYLEISTLIYIPFLILYYVSLVYSFLPQSLRSSDFILTSIIGTLSILCIIYIFDSLQKEDPEVFAALLEFWIAFTILLIFLVVYLTKENIELKRDRQAFSNLVTFGNKNEIGAEFLSLYSEYSDKNSDYKVYSGIYNKKNGVLSQSDDVNKVEKGERKDKDDEKGDKDDEKSDKDDEKSDKDDMDSGQNADTNESVDSSESQGTSNRKKQFIKNIIIKNTLIGVITLVMHCFIAFFISKVLKTLREIKKLRESSIELQSLATK